MKRRWVMAGMVGLCGMAQAAMVTIGNAGNAADTTGYGTVDYNYRISKYEVTIAQMTDSGIGNSNENCWNLEGNDFWNAGDMINAPASYVSWFEAAQYCNWLTSGNPTNGAYYFNGSGVLTGVDRATAIATYGTVYALPTENEWYKAAYFKNEAYSLYANGSDIAPIAGVTANYNDGEKGAWVVGTGGAEQNGTYDMMGNVWEWTESAFDGSLNNMIENRVMRGGVCYYGDSYLRSTDRFAIQPATESAQIGFRVVQIGAVPEPATALSLMLGGLVITGYRRFFGRV